MSDATADHRRPWWKRWWGIALIAAGVIILIGISARLAGDSTDETEAPGGSAAETSAPDGAATTEPEECEDAPPDLIHAISEGLTADGGASLSDGKAVEVREDLRNDRGWPVFVIGAELIGAGRDGATGTWATDAAGEPILALNPVAREFSDWEAAAGTGSPVVGMRDRIAASDEAALAEECASG